MKPAPFVYHAPTSLEEAVRLFATLENARVLAGGQSFMPMLNMRLIEPAHVIDINGIPSLAGIEQAGDVLEIGAMTRQRDLEFSPLVASACPLMREALTHVGHRQTRNRGTIGGSLCHLDPTAELVSVATAYDAIVHAAGPNGRRDIPFADFPIDYLTTALTEGEILSGVRLPLWPPTAGHAFVEYARRHGDYAIVSAAVLLDVAGDGRIARASVTLGGVAAAPMRMREIEEALRGAHPSAKIFETAAEKCRSVEAIDDPFVPARYRQRLSVSLVDKALKLAASRVTIARATEETAA